MTNVVPEPGSGLKTLSPTVSVGGLVARAAGVATVEVTPLTTTKDPEGASERVVPDTVIAGPPGASG